MSKNHRMTEFEIASKVRAKTQFFVGSKAEQNDALKCAKFLGLTVTTRRRDDKSGWDVVPVKQ